LPWAIVSQDRVEDGEKLSGDGDESDNLGFADVKKALVRILEKRVAAGRDESGRESDGANWSVHQQSCFCRRASGRIDGCMVQGQLDLST
jgi:hypothetical protein